MCAAEEVRVADGVLPALRLLDAVVPEVAAAVEQGRVSFGHHVERAPVPGRPKLE